MSDFEQKHLEALNALRDETKKLSPEQKSEINKLLDSQEEKNQAKLRELNEKSKKIEELEARYNSLEADLKRGLGGEEKQAKTQELKAFETYLRKQSQFLGQEELKYLRTDVDSEGGYLVPSPLEGEIIKKITEISNLRSVARVRPMSTKTSSTPSRTNIVSAGMVGEGETDSLSTSAYGLEKLIAKKAQVTSQSTVEELEDAGYDVLNLMSQDVAETMAQLEGSQFVNGNGAGNNCEGFLTNSNVPFIVSTVADKITFDSLIHATGQLKYGYNPIYAFNRKTLAEIRKLKDGEGGYLWQAGNLAAGVPNQLNGYNYIILPDMPDIGANTYPVIFGDFARGYVIGDRKGMTMLRDEITKKREGKIEFTWYKRFAGMVQLPEAFVKIKISA
jgi:HK97 family phage major capsid protein